MTGMVPHREFLGDHPRDHRGSPHARVQAVRHGSTVDDVGEGHPLLLSQLARAAAAVALEHCIESVRLVTR